ncbi:MAG: transporter substrate-binding domain-containing protein [Desulfobacterales bacterium]|nr:transporter substrate-binding domain-containing protein [Desulfobacterales bacterium]
MKKILFILTGIWLIAVVESVNAKTINLTIDERYWYPFAYIENDQPKGMHVDIIKEALKNLGYEIKIKPLPRKRSIMSCEEGEVDGVISIAFHPELAKSLEFPSDAANPPQSQWGTKESKWRIMQVDQMIVTLIDNNYEFDGDMKSIPNPVRVPRGETIIADLEKFGLYVEEAREDNQNFGKLLRDKDGSVITSSIMAENMDNTPEFKNKFRIQAIPLASQSYFLAFSLKSTLNADEKNKIWDEIKRLRDDYVFMLVMFSQY